MATARRHGHRWIRGRAKRYGPRPSAPGPLQSFGTRLVRDCPRGKGVPGQAFADAVLVRASNANTGGSRQAVPGGGDFWGDEKRRAGVGAHSAPRHLTRRICPSAVSAANAASYAARPRTEHRSGVGAQRRSPQHEPPPGTACRDARKVARRRTAAMGRKQTVRWTTFECGLLSDGLHAEGPGQRREADEGQHRARQDDAGHAAVVGAVAFGQQRHVAGAGQRRRQRQHRDLERR